MLQHEGTGMADSISSVLLAREDCASLLSQIEQPTLLMSGSEDAFSPPADMRKYSAGMKNHKFVEIQGMGHLLALETPALVAAEIDSFWRNP
jgi:pimeloyl-ACP methyl ester carboxylesterase